MTTIYIMYQYKILIKFVKDDKLCQIALFMSLGPNRTARFITCNQLFEYQHLLLLKYIWWTKF